LLVCSLPIASRYVDSWLAHNTCWFAHYQLPPVSRSATLSGYEPCGLIHCPPTFHYSNRHENWRTVSAHCENPIPLYSALLASLVRPLQRALTVTIPNLHQSARINHHSTALSVRFTLVLVPLTSVDIWSIYRFHLSETLRSYLANRLTDRVAFHCSTPSHCYTPSPLHSVTLHSFPVPPHCLFGRKSH